MFKGIIEGLGSVTHLHRSGKSMRMSVVSDFDLDGTNIGDSIAVNGVCLTAVRIHGRQFDVDIAPETVSNTVFQYIQSNERVNLERAMRLSDRIDGHLVSGHVDGLGKILDRKNQDNAVIIKISTHPDVCRYMIHKGSVAVDGISLTINRLEKDSFYLSIIPHTATMSTIGFKPVGQWVNIETDMIGKYVERLMIPQKKSSSLSNQAGIDKAFLAKHGF
ncbi:MAG: riboflavin synthase [Candidatus Magnetomorum sp.]|nr:riboflavin synthase [Candidatus Magnetomorum sp.]